MSPQPELFLCCCKTFFGSVGIFLILFLFHVSCLFLYGFFDLKSEIPSFPNHGKKDLRISDKEIKISEFLCCVRHLGECFFISFFISSLCSLLSMGSNEHI